MSDHTCCYHDAHANDVYLRCTICRKPKHDHLEISFDNCARCGLSHAGLVAKPFERPIAPSDAPHLVWTHWALCPTNGDPILVARTGDCMPCNYLINDSTRTPSNAMGYGNCRLLDIV